MQFLLAAGFALLLLGLDINAPFESDQEPYCASAIRDVAENGHWMAPLDSYGEIYRKPPLYLWLSALVVKAAGGSVNEAATRAVGWAAGALLAGETLLVAQACLGPAAGWLAYFFLLGSYGFASQAAQAQTDMLMALLVLSAVLLAYRLETHKASIWGAGLTGVLLGFAILTKGPLALVLSGLVMMVYWGFVGQNPLRLFRRRWVWGASIIACFIGLSWYAAAWLSWRQELLTVHVLQENLGHFLPVRLGGTGEASKPLYFPMAKLLGGAMPMSLAAPAATLAIWRSRRRLASRGLLTLQASVVIVVLIFFILASSKRPVYVLPAYPALAILLAWVFFADERLISVLDAHHKHAPGRPWDVAKEHAVAADAAQEPSAPTAARPERAPDSAVDHLRDAACVSAALGFVAILGGCAVGGFAPRLLLHTTARFAPTDAGYAALFIDFATRLVPELVMFALASLAAVAIIMAGLWRRRSSAAGFGMALSAVAAVGLWLGLLRPAHADLYTLKGFVATARSVSGQAPVYVLGGEDYQVSFYFGKTVPIWRSEDMAKPALSSPIYLIGWSDELTRVQPPAGYQLEINFCAGAKRPRGQICLAHVSPPPSTTTR